MGCGASLPLSGRAGQIRNLASVSQNKRNERIQWKVAKGLGTGPPFILWSRNDTFKITITGKLLQMGEASMIKSCSQSDQIRKCHKEQNMILLVVLLQWFPPIMLQCFIDIVFSVCVPLRKVHLFHVLRGWVQTIARTLTSDHRSCSWSTISSQTDTTQLTLIADNNNAMPIPDTISLARFDMTSFTNIEY